MCIGNKSVKTFFQTDFENNFPMVWLEEYVPQLHYFFLKNLGLIFPMTRFSDENFRQFISLQISALLPILYKSKIIIFSS